MTKNSKPILLVDDDNIDMMIVKRSLKALQVPNQLVYMPDGQAALEYLTGQGNEKPGVVFLDLNMPRMNGWELLEHIAADTVLKDIPVAILTTSNNPDDISRAEKFKPPVVSYLTKPADFQKSIEMLGKQLEELNLIEPKNAAVS